MLPIGAGVVRTLTPAASSAELQTNSIAVLPCVSLQHGPSGSSAVHSANVVGDAQAADFTSDQLPLCPLQPLAEIRDGS
eukprot:5771081-Karenia_brevis.AAC.1